MGAKAHGNADRGNPLAFGSLYSVVYSKSKYTTPSPVIDGPFDSLHPLHFSLQAHRPFVIGQKTLLIPLQLVQQFRRRVIYANHPRIDG
ncbi:hypothetical protein LCGC14_0300770 [marine sediment metagenome]|uniref:Uncharacterized protein n=1 Tax=marine sediment metagenome TaxID=412755 RepID=A0A0F9WWJ4_9ZZZZ